MTRKHLNIAIVILVVISFFVKGAVPIVPIVALITLLFFNRGLILAVRANGQIVRNNDDKGYELLYKAYKAGGIPVSMINGYIFFSLKRGEYDRALNAIEDILNNRKNAVVTETQKKMILTQKALYLWKQDRLDEGLEILENLHSEGFKNSIFFGNYSFFLYLKGDYKKAEDICNQGFEYEPTDKVTLDNFVSIYIETGEFDKAKYYFSKLIDLNPKFAEAYYHGSIVEYHLGNFEKSNEYCKKAYEFKLDELSTITKEELDKLINKFGKKL